MDTMRNLGRVRHQAHLFISVTSADKRGMNFPPLRANTFKASDKLLNQCFHFASMTPKLQIFEHLGYVVVDFESNDFGGMVVRINLA